MRAIVALSVVTLWVELVGVSPYPRSPSSSSPSSWTAWWWWRWWRWGRGWGWHLRPRYYVLLLLWYRRWRFAALFSSRFSQFLFKPVCIHLASQDIIVMISPPPPSSSSPWPPPSSSWQARTACKICYRCCPSFIFSKTPFAVHGGYCVRAHAHIWSDHTFAPGACVIRASRMIWWHFCSRCTKCDQSIWSGFDLITLSSRVYMWSEDMAHICFDHIFANMPNMSLYHVMHAHTCDLTVSTCHIGAHVMCPGNKV